ncbi:MAG: hypothetical protein RLN75_01865, partial [Longimicrobiales bacterium]
MCTRRWALWKSGRSAGTLLLGLVLVATACSDPTGPIEYRGIGGYGDFSPYPTEILRLNDRTLVLDIS